MFTVKAGSTDVSVPIQIIDSTDGSPETAVENNSAGLDLWYWRIVDPGSTPEAYQSIPPVALASLTAAHSDGGIEHIRHGKYRLDLPDAAVAAGAIAVQIGGTVTGMQILGPVITLVDYDPQDAVRLGLSDVKKLTDGIIEGVAQTGTLSTTQMTTDLSGFADDELIGRIVVFTGGTANGQATDITDYSSTNGLVTFTAINTAPANNDPFKII